MLIYARRVFAKQMRGSDVYSVPLSLSAEAKIVSMH
jgi:hypothetical protein